MQNAEVTEDIDVEDMIEEIVCIYKKIRQGREYKTYQFKHPSGEDSRSTCLDFNKHILNDRKYLLYHGGKLIESGALPVLPAFSEFFWLNIFDPNAEDLLCLSKIFDIHETTIADIREKNSPEKIDVYMKYAYLSLRMFANKKSREDINFNVILFDNFIITTHNKHWQGVNNILNFCHVISTATALNPSWVFLSIITEFLQDVLFSMDEIEKQADLFSMKHSVRELHSNFFYLHQVFILKQYTRPKIKILRKFLKTDFPKTPVKKPLKMCIKDFLDIRSMLGEAKRSFERNQDMILGLRDIELAEQSHQMNMIMNRISKITFFFLPIQCVAGVWGMNVRVPWQNEDSVVYFWLLTLCGPMLCFLYFFITENKRKPPKRLVTSHQV